MSAKRTRATPSQGQEHDLRDPRAHIGWQVLAMAYPVMESRILADLQQIVHTQSDLYSSAWSIAISTQSSGIHLRWTTPAWCRFWLPLRRRPE